MRLIKTFAYILLVSINITACSAEEELNPSVVLTPAEQQDYYGRAFNSVFVGIGKMPDEDAATLFRKAAENGHAPSQWHLGRLYEYGEGVDKDFARSLNWKERAADQGYLNAELDMAEAYMFGEGVGKNLKKAVALLKSAAEKKHPKALYLLSVFYKIGIEVEKDEGKSKAYDLEANKIYKDKDASSKLLKYGNPATISLKSDHTKRVRLTMILLGFDEIAAREGDVKAQSLGAHLFVRVREYEEALEWAWAASRAGDFDAQSLITLIVGPLEVPADKEKTIDAYTAGLFAERSLAQEGSSDEKKEGQLELIRRNLDIIKNKLSDDDIKIAIEKFEKPKFETYLRIGGKMEKKH